MVAWAYMFFETLGFSPIRAIQSCALGFKSWEREKGEHNPFFYTFQRQFFQIVPILNPTKYAYVFKPRLLHMCMMKCNLAIF